MFKKEDRIRSEIRPVKCKNRNRRKSFHLHKCKNCEKDLWLTCSEEKRTQGYCKKCVYSHSNYYKSKNIFNEKGEKQCTKCKIYLPIDDFEKDKYYKKVKTICRRCTFLKKYGINGFDYNVLLIKQNNKCAICGEKEKIYHHKRASKNGVLSVDHCHKTGKVRGLLCGACNRGLGLFFDDENKLWKAITYLKKSKTN